MAAARNTSLQANGSQHVYAQRWQACLQLLLLGLVVLRKACMEANKAATAGLPDVDLHSA